MKTRRKCVKPLAVLLALCVITAMLSVPALAAVIDDTGGNIIRTTETHYFTTVKIVGTRSGDPADTFEQTEAETAGNISDAAITEKIAGLKTAFTNWAATKEEPHVSFPTEGITNVYYLVHDEIRNASQEGVTICTVLEKYQVYTITAEAAAAAKTYSIEFFPSNSWTLGSKTASTTMTTGCLVTEEEHIPISGFDPASMRIVVTAPSNFSTTLSIVENGDADYTTLANRADPTTPLPEGETLTFRIIEYAVTDSSVDESSVSVQAKLRFLGNSEQTLTTVYTCERSDVTVSAVPGVVNDAIDAAKAVLTASATSMCQEHPDRYISGTYRITGTTTAFDSRAYTPTTISGTYGKTASYVITLTVREEDDDEEEDEPVRIANPNTGSGSRPASGAALAVLSCLALAAIRTDGKSRRVK